MAETPEPYPWTRRENETEVAYEAFRTYLNQGAERSLANTSKAVGKTAGLMERWSQTHEWKARVLAYDRHMDAASTDGLAEELAAVRNRHLTLSEKLLDHLDARLDYYIAGNQDPSVRWTQAFSAATKAQEAALRMRETGKESGMLEKAMAILEELARNGQ